MDYSPESLKGIENAYFELVATSGFARYGLTRQAFEGLMGVYFAALAVRSDPDVRWVVKEFGFTPGKYELGVVKGNSTTMVTVFANLYLQKPTKNKNDRAFRMFQQMFARPE